MYNKKLQATVSINNDDSLLPDNLRELYLEYYILENVLIDEEISYRGKSYGIEIIKKELAVNNHTFMEKERISDICCSESTVKELIQKLVYNTVTPIGLNNVIEDLVGVI